MVRVATTKPAHVAGKSSGRSTTLAAPPARARSDDPSERAQVAQNVGAPRANADEPDLHASELPARELLAALEVPIEHLLIRASRLVAPREMGRAGWPIQFK